MVLLGILVIVFAYIFLGVAEAAFQKIGFSREEFVLILGATFIGSFINIPLARINNVESMVYNRQVRVFWGVTYRIPQLVRQRVSTLVTINLGGAIIPILVSLTLLFTHVSLWEYIFLGVFLSSIIIHLVARRERGVGIVTPAFVPPIAAAIIALLISPASGAAIFRLHFRIYGSSHWSRPDKPPRNH